MRVYDREKGHWNKASLEAMVEAGQAKTYATPEGVVYVVQVEGGGSVAVRPHQVFTLESPVTIPAIQTTQESLPTSGGGKRVLTSEQEDFLRDFLG